MAALFVTDLAYRKGHLLSVVNHSHVLTALWSMLLMSIALMGIIYRAEKRFMLIEPDGASIIISYVIGIWLAFN